MSNQKEIFCEECEYDLTVEEIKNANELPILGKEAFTNGEIYICANCYQTGYNDWISESMQPCDTYDSLDRDY